MENRQAVQLLHQKSLIGNIVSVLRQELDSMVRVIYLLHITDKSRRSSLVAASIQGNKWKKEGTKLNITDREMVELAITLNGWEEYVYRFGCAFIHLSKYHDYKSRDPFTDITENDRKDILTYLKHYHGGPEKNNITFNDITPYLPAVLEKISGNLEHYLGMLERNENL